LFQIALERAGAHADATIHVSDLSIELKSASRCLREDRLCRVNRRFAITVTRLLVVSLPLSGQAPVNIPPAGSRTPRYSYLVVHTYPHDPAAFTQGLEYRDGFLYEGTGLTGRSSIRRVAIDTGKVVQEHRIPPEYFGEGITLMGGTLFELTWKSQIGFVYDTATFQERRTFKYVGEGWGLTHDDSNVIMSDGTASLRFLDPNTLTERRRITVTDGGVAITNLNELESVQGEIWANVWQTDYIARVSPRDGHVVGWVNLKGLLGGPYASGSVDVLNGIAYDAEHDRIFVTGKLWPKLFEIKVKPAN
jgi:glutaminyl-peptide cyclotransferase